jgi:hypothetical protein|nr:MAG TPA: Head Tail Connector Protein [Caudoviricetes sp.]
MKYLTFEEYQNLGGKCSKDVFPSLQFDTESKMDYITSGRLSKMIDEIESVPEAVQMLEVKLIDIENASSNSAKQGPGLTSYSNGIESFGYDTSKDSEEILAEKFSTLMKQYLYPEYPELFYRGRWVSRARYSNPSQ